MTASLFGDDGGGLIGAKIFVGRQAGVPENTERQGKLRRLKLRQQEAQAGIGIRFVVNQQIGFIGAARSKCHYLGAEPFQPDSFIALLSKDQWFAVFEQETRFVARGLVGEGFVGAVGKHVACFAEPRQRPCRDARPPASRWRRD